MRRIDLRFRPNRPPTAPLTLLGAQPPAASHSPGDSTPIRRAKRVRRQASALLVSGILCVVLFPRNVDAADEFVGGLAAGKQLFLAQCAGCHGQGGAGDGPAVSFLYPRPRNFLEQQFKLGGSQGDVVRVISLGIPGTSMPAFTAVLAPSDIDALASYVRSLAGDSAVGLPIEPVSVPEPVGSVARGQKIYVDSCTNCHGAGGEGDGPSAVYLTDDSGVPIRPPNYARSAFKGGADPAALFTRISAGMPGTPMPGYGEVYSEQDRWDMVAYLRSLITTPSVAPANAIVVRRVLGLPADANEPQWASAEVVTLALNPLWQRPSWPSALEVRALHDGAQIAFQLRWEDSTQDRTIGRAEDFTDAVAVMLPAKPGTIPFVGMGQGEEVARILHWRAVGDRNGPEFVYPFEVVDSSPLAGGPDVRPALAAGNPMAQPGVPGPGLLELVAAGPGTVTAVPPKHVHVDGNGDWLDGRWRVRLVRPLDVPRVDVPMEPGTRTNVAFAVWDGSAGDRNGQKSITQWIPLEIEK